MGIVHFFSHYGLVGLFFISALGVVAVPVSVEAVFIFYGYLALLGRFPLAGVLAAGFLGSACGITLSYLLGYFFGWSLVKDYGRFFGLTEEKVRRLHDLLQRRGGLLLVFGFFIPGVRHLTGIVYGIFEMEFTLFIRYACAGALLWTAVMVSVGYLLGIEWVHTTREFHRHAFVAFAIAFPAVLLVSYVVARIRKKKEPPSKTDTSKK